MLISEESICLELVSFGGHADFLLSLGNK
jgi:hypothetical protein